MTCSFLQYDGASRNYEVIIMHFTGPFLSIFHIGTESKYVTFARC
jgi:hypothetical protein